jgi:hypothetical protein
MQRPSIIPHAQNYAHCEWTLLFDLIWQGWAQIDAQDAMRSRTIVGRWRDLRFLAFRRLAAAAMDHSRHFTDDERLEALLDG